MSSDYDYSSVKVIIATPCYGGMVSTEYMRSMCGLVGSFIKTGVKHEVRTISNDSLVTRARACLLSCFLSDPQATHLLFIDADITFNAKSVYRLLAADRDVVGGVYPMKSVNWDAVKDVLDKDPKISNDSLAHRSATYVINVHSTENDRSLTGQMKEGFVKVANIGTGFLMIKKNVFEKMIEAYPDAKYKNDIPSFKGKPEEENMYTFFDTWRHPETKRYLSEDYAFCQKWIDLGGEVWADLMCPLHHRGTYVFKGSAIDYFKQYLRVPATNDK